MLSKFKGFGLRATLGALALGIGLAGAAVATAPQAKAYDGWHHGWHAGYGWRGGWYGPRVSYGWGAYPRYYGYRPYYRPYYPGYYSPPAYYYPPYGGLTVTIPIR
ncbi:MAG TPA: sulfur globule protein precursor [Alphaproteobacteria bacterium]|jgi:hypothetical protein|nr:sulfur globule protein precursor [Alphaproteobacteria bacterium]